MKKILTFLVFIVGTSSLLSMAQGTNTDYDPANSNLGMPTEICTVTSEPCIAGTTSSDYGSCSNSDGKSNCSFASNGQMSRYRCCVQAESGFVDLIKSIYQYVFFIAMVLGVLFLVILGIGYSISGVGTEEIKTKAKEKIIAGIIGLVALALVPWILQTIAPFFFQ